MYYTLSLNLTFIEKRKAPHIRLNNVSKKKTGLKTCNKATNSDTHAWEGLHAHR